MSDVLPSEWALILADWRRCSATVEIYLRGGAVLGPGRVDSLPRSGLDSAQLIGRSDGRETKWTFDLAEVAAIKAVAS